ncbi:MAG: alpha/beta fold hydrolase [Rhodobacteraceae bacterium]|nr:alpha/beta fold hydrolase [Paracoccaceae bacterium]
MTDSSVRGRLTRAPLPGLVWLRTLALAGLILSCLACVWVLETRFQGLEVETLEIAETPVTVYRMAQEAQRPLVVMAHGFGGSRQMMDQLAVSLARQGMAVASLDLPGHGRNTARLSPDITRIDGTTAQLVQVVDRVTDALMLRSDSLGPVSFVGHSMATDVVIRAAQARSDVNGVVAISMYSPAVTERSPQALLVLSGATESHLRAAGLDAVRLIDPDALEGQTIAQGDVVRRTAVAPWVGHVGVLYSRTSLDETTRWLRDVTGQGLQARLDQTGWIAGILLVCLVALGWPLARILPQRRITSPELSRGSFVLSITAPIPAVLLVAALPTFGIAGQAAFGSLAAILGLWGGVQLLILWRAGVTVVRPDIIGLLAFLGYGLGVFALALDRYGAAFLPVGPRFPVMLGLLLGTVPAMMADTILVQGASWRRRLLARVALLTGLAGAMALSPSELGLTFTTLPVLVLFFVVYGSLARWIAERRGAGSVALGKGLVLAWAFAASTPLFAVAALP